MQRVMNATHPASTIPNSFILIRVYDYPTSGYS